MIFAILLTFTVVLGYFLNQYLHSYWTRHGFKQVAPKFAIGDAYPLLTLKHSFGTFFESLYTKYKDLKVVGLYFSYRPVLLVTDAKIVQDILIKDFGSFHDRPMPVDEKYDPLSGHLFNLPGQKWRDLRVKLSPTFTSGKLKGMFPIIQDCGQVLQEYLVKNGKTGKDVFEFRDLMARFNTNIISSVAFGIDNDCINEPDHIFRRMGAKFFESTLWNGLRNMLSFVAPVLYHHLRLKQTQPEVEEFIFSIVKQTVNFREQKNFSRNDMMQMLIQLKNQGYVSVDKGEKDSDSRELKNELENIKTLNINELAAQVFVFFVAGFETSSSTMSFCLFELAKRPDLQKKLQEELDRVFKGSDKEGITYEMYSELKYLECCIDETLRKYPIVPVQFRTAERDYNVSGTNFTIPKGTSVYIPSLAFHRDPEIYENPMKFKPERFTNSSNGGGMAEGVFYTPFGDGPRNCIGMRMGKLTAKVGLASILTKYNIELSDKNMLDQELEFDATQFVLTPLKRFDIKITPRF